MIQLVVGGVVAAFALMLLYLWTEFGLSIWYPLGAAAFSAVMIASGIADLRDRKDDWP